MCRILVTMSASSLCLLSMSKLRKIIHNITGSTQTTYISAYISIIMEIWSTTHTGKMYENDQRSVKIMETWFATHTVKIYGNGERDVKPATNSILNLK